MEDSKLLQALEQLVQVVTGRPPSQEKVSELWDVIENSYLDEPENVPSWLLDMFNALVEKRPVPPTEMTSAKGEDGSPYNFLVELGEVVEADWVEYGEYFLMQFPSIGLEAKVSIEDGKYQVRPINQK